jgi:hypothetical protein
MYRSLDSTKIVHTLEILERRVAERFPKASLSKVCAELTQIARENDERARMLARPNYVLRALGGLVTLAGLALIGWVATRLEVKHDAESIFSTLQGIDAGLNIVLVAGATVIFLVTLEARWKRQQALGDLEELRSIIHVIDMHQLTKDPATSQGDATPSSPARTLTPHELVRYLDYCSEMLSMAAKVAAVYAQSTNDPQVVEASSDLQQITANLSTKIWQKINIAQRIASAQTVAIAAIAGTASKGGGAA